MTSRVPVGARLLPTELVVSVEGDDARTWLNGQITSDLKRLDAECSVYGLVLTSKGRILADVVVHDRRGALHFATPRASWPALHEQLEKYIIMEDVTLRETDLAVLALVGAHELAPADVTKLLDGLDASAAVSDRLGPSVDVLVASPRADEALARIAAALGARGGHVLDDDGWERARIEAAVPRFPADFGERTYPQEAGLKRRALSFDKGCYHGQEVVCMLENRGQVTRSLVALQLSDSAAAGTAIRRGDDVVGELTSAASLTALGLVKRAHAEVGRTFDVGAGTATVVGLVA